MIREADRAISRVLLVAVVAALIWSFATAAPPAALAVEQEPDGFVIGEAVRADGVSADARDRVHAIADGRTTLDALPTAVSGLKTITCKGRYDYPHAGDSSGFKRVNAHLIVTCTGTVPLDAQFTQITASSRMTDITGGRLGLVSTKSGRGSLRVGGDLACLAATRSYQAVGSVSLLFPPGYTPGATKSGAKSVIRDFARNPNTGNCVLK